MKSILQYPRSKWRIAKQIVSLFPPHHTYLEPYFGSGAVLFNKSRSDIETINDLDENVVNFFQWLKNDPEKLAHELWYIPYSHSVYNNAVQNKAQNSLEQAVNYCVMLNMGHGFRIGGPASGWKSDIHGRERAYAAKNWASLPSRLEEAAARLRGVQIECMPALELIPKGSSINMGGATSVKECGLYEALSNGEYQFYDRDKVSTQEEKQEIALKAFTSDYFLGSVNAMSEDGVFINIDGNANRVAAYAYGPKHVLLIVGMNKVVKTEADAMSRARNEAAPINAQRFGIDTPCSKNGTCFDCKSPQCICCQILTTRFSRVKGRFQIILVDENLGF